MNDDLRPRKGKTLILRPSDSMGPGVERQEMGRGRTKAVVMETRNRRSEYESGKATHKPSPAARSPEEEIRSREEWIAERAAWTAKFKAEQSAKKRQAAKEARAAKRAADAKRAAEGKCKGYITVRRIPPGREQARETGIVPCDRAIARSGYCRLHYNRHVLKIRADQSGEGHRTRPFADWQLPGNMTDKDHKVLKKLPVSTPYLECIEAMNASGRVKERLKPILERPAKVKRMRTAQKAD